VLLGGWLDLMILEVFSNHSDSVVLGLTKWLVEQCLVIIRKQKRSVCNKGAG